MYTTRGYPVDVRLQAQKQRERAEWRRQRAASLRRLLRQLAAR